MNKFITVLVVVVASIAVASAGYIPDSLDDERSELSLNPVDDVETQNLKGTNVEGFRDFCIRSRDAVVGDMRKRGNIFTSDVFASIFRSLGEVGQSGIDAATRASDKLSHQLASPDSPIEGDSEEQVDRIIAEGQRAIQEAGNQPQGFLAAFMHGVKSFGAAGYGQAISKVMELQKVLGAKAVTENLVGFCEQLANYEKQAITIFGETKQNLVDENPEQYQNVKYSDVAPKCVTANRLTRADGFCKFVLAAKAPLGKIFGLQLPSEQ